MLVSFFLGNATARKLPDFAYCQTLHSFQTCNGSAQWQISPVSGLNVQYRVIITQM